MRELSLHILDALENSREAGATYVELTIVEDLIADRLTIAIRDNGCGMDEETLARATDPFYTSRKTRHVGLGVPLFLAAAERCNGGLTITSQVAKGTTLEVTFQYSHIDRAPLGDITSTLLSFVLGGRCDLGYLHRVNQAEFAFSTMEIKAELGDVPISHPTVREWLRAFVTDGEAAVVSLSA
jgi:Histidine kinase-, DNA gyrase B-, and HSP90-like ATPase